MVDASVIRERFAAVGHGLNERSRRLLVAAEAKTASYGGIAATARATGVARRAIGRGLKDLADPGSLSGEVRRPGSGCPTLIRKDPTLLENLVHLVGNLNPIGQASGHEGFPFHGPPEGLRHGGIEVGDEAFDRVLEMIL
jgi:hypothetical protein